MKQGARRKGFTIVELLIVVVVIAILAAITIVAYNGVQTRARDAKRISDAKQITKLVEIFKIDATDGRPPQRTSTVNMATLKSDLGTTAALPDDSTYPYQYLGSGNDYAISIYKESSSAWCQVSGGNTTTWWSNRPMC